MTEAQHTHGFLGSAEPEKKLATLLFIAFSLLYGSTIRGGMENANEASRLALVQSLTEQGKLSTDDSYFTRMTEDRAYVNGHYYSDKAPGLSLTAVPLYWVLFHLGVSFARHRGLADIFLKIPVAILAALAPMLFFMISRYYSGDLKSRLSVSLALGAGTGVFVFSGVFIAHAPAAALLLLSFYFALRARENTNWLWLSGAASGIAICFDYPSLFLAIGIHLNYLSQQKRIEVGKAFLSALPFVMLILLYNLRITGNALDNPAYHVSEWPGSPWSAGDLKFSIARISLQHAAQMFFFGQPPQSHDYPAISYRGLFLYSPFLLFGLLCIKKEHLMLLLGVLCLTVFYLGLEEAVGGCVFSNRYLVIALPFLTLPVLILAQRWPGVFSVAGGASVVMNFIGATTKPITCAHFPLGEAVTYLPRYIAIGISLSLVVVILYVIFSYDSRKGDVLLEETFKRV